MAFLSRKIKSWIAFLAIIGVTAVGMVRIPAFHKILLSSKAEKGNVHRPLGENYSNHLTQLKLNNSQKAPITGVLSNKNLIRSANPTLSTFTTKENFDNPTPTFNANFKFSQLFTGIKDSQTLAQLQKEVEKGTQDINSGLGTYNNSFNSGKESIQQWRSTRGGNKQFSSSSSSENTSLLELNTFLDSTERKGIQKYFESYIELEQKIVSIFKDHPEIKERFNNLNNQQIDNSKLQEIKESLKSVQWEGSGKIIVFKNNQNKDSLGWGDWNSNPFRHFYTQEDWKSKVVDRIQAATKKVEFSIQKNINCATGGSISPNLDTSKLQACFADAQQIEKGIEKIKNEVELTVGEKLLEWSGVLKPQ